MSTTEAVMIAALVAVAAVVIARFEALCLRELAVTPDVELRYLNRSGWTAAICLAIPVGGIAFLYLERMS